jgi:hypothetical protein
VYIEDLDTTDEWMSHEGVTVCAVGWLGDFVPSSGSIDAEVAAKLRRAIKAYAYADGFLGWHTCELCHAVDGYGELAVDLDGVRYVAPTMIGHYVFDHGYRPPDAFLRAVAVGRWWSGDGGGWVRKQRAGWRERLAFWRR